MRDRGAPLVVGLTARRAARSGALWGALFGLLVLNEAVSYRTTFPTAASRERFAASFGSNTGLSAVIGPGRQLETLQGVVAWRVFGLMSTAGAVWGLLTATRLLRAEEDAGRWELLLTGRTSRRYATVQALVGLAFGWLALWAATAALILTAGDRVGLPTSACLFYATAGTSSAALFLAVGAVTSQLATTRRGASALGASAFGVAYLVRLVADAGTGSAWLRWASPLGWVEESRPLTGSRPWALLPLALVVAGCLAAAVALAARRDVGAGALVHRRARAGSTRWLDSPLGLAVRMERGVVLSWVLGLGLLAGIFGVTAGAAEEGSFGSDVGQTVSRLGGSGSGAAAWIGYELLYLASILAFAAAGQVAALRGEEADGYLDHLLARSVSRTTWLAGRLAVGAALVLSSGLAMGVGGWVGLAGHGHVTLASMLKAGLNAAVPGLFVLGFGALLYGLVPRLAAPALYAVVLWSFLVETLGTSITSNHWLLDTAVLTHVGPVPAAPLHVAGVAVLTGAALAAGLLGMAAFRRRDLASA